MARVDTILCSKSSNMVLNDASVSKFSLDICESPPKCDFDISILLKDIDFSSSPLEIGNLKFENQSQVINCEVLSTSPEDQCHVSSINMAPINGSVEHSQNSNFDLSFSHLLPNKDCDDLWNCSVTDSDAILDLSFISSELLNSQPDTAVSLATLAKSHFSNSTFVGEEEDVNEISTLGFIENDVNYNVIPHNISTAKNKTDNISIDLDFLDELCNNDIENQSYKESGQQVSKVRIKNEAFYDNSMEDIDLSFCIKNNTTKNDSLASSPESRDSGFDEPGTYFKPNSSIKEHDLKNNISRTKKVTSAIYKPSLLSKTISCEPKSDKLKKEKALKVKKELCRNYIAAFNNLVLNKAVKSNANQIVDESNSCMISHLIP